MPTAFKYSTLAKVLSLDTRLIASLIVNAATFYGFNHADYDYKLTNTSRLRNNYFLQKNLTTSVRIFP
jgi:hypothetical protein